MFKECLAGYQSVFHHCDKIPDKISIKEGRRTLAHGSEASVRGKVGLFLSHPGLGRNIVVERCGRGKLSTACQPGSKERKPERKQPGTRRSPQSTFP